MKKLINIIFLFVLCNNYAQTFDSNKNNSQILNAADIPVEYSTGVPDIGIDLFSVPTVNSDFKLNLRMQYDLYSNTSALYSTNQIGDFWRLGILGKISRKSEGIYHFSGALMTDESYYETADNKETRMDKDIFTYDVFGNSGKFYLKRNGSSFSIEVIEQNDYAKITVAIEKAGGLIGNQLKYKITSFTIIDKFGYRYFFSTPDYKKFYSKPAEKYPIDFHLTTIRDRYNILLCSYSG